MTTKDPATSKDRERQLAAEIRRLDQRCRCLEHRLERMRTQQIRQKRIDDSNSMPERQTAEPRWGSYPSVLVVAFMRNQKSLARETQRAGRWRPRRVFGSVAGAIF